MQQDEIAGRKKAAILLVSIGTENAIKLLKYLKEDEIEQLTYEIAQLSRLDEETRMSVIEEYAQLCYVQNFYAEGGMKYVKEILEQAIGPAKASQIIDKLSQSIQGRPFESIRKADSNQLLNFIQNEHPQTIALIFSYLTPQQAAVVLSALPKEKQAEVAIRIAMMDKTSPEFTNEVEKILDRKIAQLGSEEYAASGGIQAVVDILNSVDRSTEKLIFDTLEVSNSDLAEEIRKRMFVFEDIVNLDNKAVQLFLKECDNHDLALALKGSSEEVSRIIFDNMSKRMQDILRDDIDVLGPVKLRDIEEAQQSIVGVIRKLEDAGQILVSRGGGDEIIV